MTHEVCSTCRLLLNQPARTTIHKGSAVSQQHRGKQGLETSSRQERDQLDFSKTVLASHRVKEGNCSHERQILLVP
jgi:hypothetical protein